MAEKASEADGALAQRFGKSFGTIPLDERKLAERKGTRTPKERARGAKVKLELVNFKVEPATRQLLRDTATKLGMTMTEVFELGLKLAAERADGGR